MTSDIRQTVIIATPNFYNPSHMEFYTATETCLTLAIATEKRMLADFRKSKQKVIGARIIPTKRYYRLSIEDRMRTLFMDKNY